MLLNPARTNGRPLGITVTRKFGNAVARNRAKRLFREVFRRSHDAVSARHRRRGHPQEPGRRLAFRAPGGVAEGEPTHRFPGRLLTKDAGEDPGDDANWPLERSWPVIARYVLIPLIRLYKRALSPLLGNVCRFEPSCSSYALSCLETHGALRGTLLSVFACVSATHSIRADRSPPLPKAQRETPTTA